jgi:D-tyrosyl-tRNA(Tyr) deacylase
LRAVLQRVDAASVSVEGRVVGEIDAGLVVLVGVERGDTEDVVRWVAKKSAELRIFRDEAGKMNRSVLDVGGAVLAVSQFTLLADCRKGRRPGFDRAAPPEEGQRLYELYCRELREIGLRVDTGVFGAEMIVDIRNHGPVTIILEKRSDAG